MRPEHWPLHSTLPLGPILTAASCARGHATHVLWEWGMSGMADTVELIVSELVTNAVVASRALDGGPFPVRFWMLSDRKRVLIVVWDASPCPPARLNPADDVEGGRGLMLVEALSARWDWYAAPWDRVEGKAVWALCEVSSGAN
jgi:anti-sigma regulatory factor (Ser/Thr protein kinase)